MATGIGQWTWSDRNIGNPDYKGRNWGGWGASDEHYFGELRKYYSGHSYYGPKLGGYGSRSLFDFFGGEGALLNPPKMPGNSASRAKWQLGQKHRKGVADLYFYEKAMGQRKAEEEKRAAAARKAEADKRAAEERARRAEAARKAAAEEAKRVKHLDIEKQLKALGIEHEKAIGGWRDQLSAQSADYQAQIAGLQAGWDDKTAAWNQQEVDWANQFAHQRLKHETDLAAQLDKQRGLHASQLAIQGQQSAAELAEWQKQAATERDQYAKQLQESGLQSAQQIEQLKATFAQQQEASRLAAQEERAQLESQLQTRYTEQWNKQQQDLTSTYEGLLSQAKTEAETARLQQAQEFEQKQLDQQAGWNRQAQEWATKDRLYQSQLGELKSDLGLQEGLYAGLQTQYGSLQSSSAAERQALQSQLMGLQTSSTAERQALQSQLSGLQESSTAQIGQLESRFGQAQEDWSKQQQAYIQQIGDVTGEVTGLKTTLADSQRQAQELQSAVKRNQELAIQNAERARVSASYGTQGHPVNQEVKGVKTQNELAPVTKRYGGTRSAFNRKGLRITNLNI